MSLTRSSQGFVRALKAPSDPPAPGGPLKIVIARRAWDDTSFRVPSKSEVIVDWILNKIFKEKHNEPPQNPLLDPPFWNLLYDVLSFSDVSTPSRPLKSWLPTLLSRTPIAPILIRFLYLLDGLDLDLQNQLSEIFSSCFGIMWPLAVQKIGTETLLECFGALLNSLSLCERNKGIGLVGGMVISSYRNSLWNSSNKKKIYLLFLQTHLCLWLDCSTVGAQSDSYQLFLEASYEAGIDTILNVDILRQTRDSKSENTLFEAIATASSSNPTILAALPRTFASYIQVLKKHRSSLFGQGSPLPGVTTDESNACGMRFFMDCNSLLDYADLNTRTWSTRVRLLSVMDRENIFSRGQLDALIVLNQLVESAINTLEGVQNVQTKRTAFPTYAIDSLSALARIDYNLILPTLPRILSAILAHESSPAYLNFLHFLLNYHTKTRTMNTYVTSFLSALSPQRKFLALGSPPVVYQCCHSGPLMDPGHLDSLSKAIYGFLPSTQLCPIVNLVAKTLGEAMEQLHGAKEITDDNDEPQKKRKPIGVPTSVSQMDSLAIGASLSTRLSSIIISSLPLGSAPENTRREILQSLSNIRNTLIPRALTRAFRYIRKTGEAIWGLQVTATGLLRFRYALDTSRHLSLDPSDHLKLLSTTQAMLALDGLMSELRIEIFRTLLGSTALRDSDEIQMVINHMITYLAESLQASDVESNCTAASSLALLHMIIERWLPIIELMASPTQLKSFLQHIMHIHFQESQTSKVSAIKTSLLAKMFQSAQFWEHPNIRSVFLAFISDATLALDNISDAFQLSSALPVYRMLLLFPMEYIPRSHRTELIKRAMAADVFITQSLDGSNPTTSDSLESLIILRVFLNRIFLYSGFTEQSVQKISELSKCMMMMGGSAHMQYDTEFSSATTNLLRSLFSELLYKSTMSNPDIVSTFIAFLEMFQDGLIEGTDLRSRYLIQMIEVLDERFSMTSFPHEIRTLLQNFHRRFSSSVLPRIREFVSNGISTESLDRQSSVLEMWCVLLSFGQWLALTENPLPRLGKTVLVDIVKTSTKIRASPDTWGTLLATALAILLKEMHYVKETDCLSHLSLITTSYLTFTGILGTDGRKRLDNSLSGACKTFSSPHFSHILDLVGEGLTTLSTSEDILAYLIEFSVLLLYNHPQGTLKYTQLHATGCLSAFVGRSCFTEGPVCLRVQVLEFVVQHCSYRPAVLRLGDVNNIWTLLARFLFGSRVHDNETTSSIFHKIVMIISALVRFRRDLVVLTLPHLGVVLRQLLKSVRSVRPLLGSKQTTLVADTLPRWINSRNPLGAEEGRILARLLETLAIKSIVRNNATASEAQKAESLAKPFSKHASYVLKAYIEAMNDPLCVLHSDLRKELQQGLYALCSMMSDYSRDATMLSALDSGGRATMKALWKEYEKQKYVGKG